MNANIEIKHVLEAALFTADEPLSADKLSQIFDEDSRPSLDDIRVQLSELQADYAERGVELAQVASGYRFQAKQECALHIQRLWEKRPPRYSRALMETLALIAYRQPITRGEIEDVRGVAVSSQTIKTLMDRDWIKIAGHRDVPGKPALYSTTKSFLDYFNLTKLSDLPPLSELVDFESLEKQLGLQLPSFKDDDENTEATANNSDTENTEALTAESVSEEAVEQDGESALEFEDGHTSEGDAVELAEEALVEETVN